MADIRLKFERELKFKITQKAKANQLEDAFLVKTFKYFDLNNSGTVTPDEFFKTVQKIGVTSFEENVSFIYNNVSSRLLIPLIGYHEII